MAKYIDAERLMAQIDRIEEDARKVRVSGTDKEAIGADSKVKLCLKLKSLIDSLQQEKPDFPTTDEEIEMLLATHPKVEVPNKYKTPDWLWKKQEQPESSKGKFVFPDYLYARTVDNKTIDVSYAPQSLDAVEYIKNDPTEQPEVDLEKELDQWRHEHFAGKRDEHYSGEYLERSSQLDLAHHFAQWKKEQMMSEAVEGEITKDNRGNNVVRAGVFNKDFEYGDKVRIIIVKENEK